MLLVVVKKSLLHFSFHRESREDDCKQSSDLPSLEIDFIDVNAIKHVDDDVFVNLDAFDMLSEFPDLEGLEHSHNGSIFFIFKVIN